MRKYIILIIDSRIVFYKNSDLVWCRQPLVTILVDENKGGGQEENDWAQVG